MTTENIFEVSGNSNVYCFESVYLRQWCCSMVEMTVLFCEIYEKEPNMKTNMNKNAGSLKHFTKFSANNKLLKIRGKICKNTVF